MSVFVLAGNFGCQLAAIILTMDHCSPRSFSTACFLRVSVFPRLKREVTPLTDSPSWQQFSYFALAVFYQAHGTVKIDIEEIMVMFRSIFNLGNISCQLRKLAHTLRQIFSWNIS